jgi:hypothetical protein
MPDISEQESKITSTFELTILSLTKAEARLTAFQHEEHFVASIALDPNSLSTLDPNAYGALLTAQLFVDKRLRDAWLQSRASSRHSGVLAVRLCLEPTDELHALRWETLCDPIDGQPLALSQRVRLARTLDSSTYSAPQPLASRLPALRALVIVAAPSDLAEYGLTHIDADGELARARAALGDIPVLALGDVIGAQGRATLKAIQAAFGAGPEIVIMVAHGALHEGQPILYLEDDQGKTAPLFGTELADTMQHQARHPLLLVLASCHSAGDNYAVLASLGPRLAQAGLPAVLALQGDIAMRATKQLLPRLIIELVKDGQIDRSLAAARAALGSGGPWWQPVLFLRGDGRLWAEPQGEVQPRSATASQTINNLASNQGAQGSFYGPVTFNQSGISIGGTVGTVQHIDVSGSSIGSIIGTQANYGDLPASIENITSVEDLRQRLAGYREKLAAYLYRLAIVGNTRVSPDISHGIREARSGIQRIKAKLLALGAQIDYQPNDTE